MQCWQCGKTVREGAKLCVYCGASLTDADDYERPHDEFERPPEEKPREPPRSRKTSGSGQRNRFPPQLPGQRPWPRDDGAGASRPAAGGAPSDSPKAPTHDRSSARSQDRADANDRGREARDIGLDGPSLPRIVYEPAAGSSRRSGNSASSQSGDSASSQSGDGARLPDPLDDPRAPHILRSTPDQVPGRYDAGGGGRRSSRSANADAWAGTAGGGGHDPRQVPDRAAYPQGRGSASSGGRYQQSWDDEWRDRSPTGEYAAGYDMRTGGYDSESMEAWQGGPGGAGGQGEHGLWPFYQDYADYPGGRGGDYDPPGAYRPAPPGYDPRRDGEWPESWPAPAVGGRGPGGPGRKQPQRRRRSPLFGVALGLVALVLVAAGVVERHALSQLVHRLTAGSPTPPPVFATYTPGPTPTVLPNYKQWANTHAGYVMNYPQQWIEKTDNSPSGGQSDYTDTFQQTSPFIEFAIEQAQVNGSQTDQAVIDAEVHAAEQKGTTFTLTPGSTQNVAVGGEQWLREEYDGTVSGVQFHFALLSTHHQGRSYVIAMLAQSASFTNLDKTVFQPVLRSFRFLG
jgi:zinc-ribbon domain